MPSAVDKVDTSLQEPLTRELRLEVKSQLKEYWKFYRRDVQFRRFTKVSWYTTERMVTLNEATPDRRDHRLKRFFNKATAFYVTPSGQQNNNFSFMVFGCIYKDWFLHHNNEPNYEFTRFFADLVHITSNGPQAVAEIVQAHKILCDQASQLLTNPVPGWVVNTDTYKLLPLFRAIILILDELDESVEEDENDRFSLDEFSRSQSVLMIKTGDDAHLSAPITFEHIKKQAFQLKRGDCNLDGIEVIRVSLAAAVHFITTLQQREDAAMPGGMTDIIDLSICPTVDSWDFEDLPSSANVWAEKMLQRAERLGFEAVYDAKNALNRALAARRGDDSQKLTPHPFSRCWK